MNTAGIPLVFTGAIQSRDDIHYISSLIALASGDFKPLVIVTQSLRMQDRSGGEFVSLGESADFRSRRSEYCNSLPESISRVTTEYIELDLLLVKARPLSISKQCMQKAHSILEKCTPRSKAPRPGVQDPYTDRLVEQAIGLMNKGPVGLEWSRSILGSAIECGIDWIRRFPDVLEKDANLEAWTHGTFKSFNPVFTEAATDLLSHFGITNENSPEFDNKFLHPTIRFFTCITDDRLRFLVQLPRRIQTRASGDFSITGRISNRSWIAISRAVSHVPFFQQGMSH